MKQPRLTTTFIVALLFTGWAVHSASATSYKASVLLNTFQFTSMRLQQDQAFLGEPAPASYGVLGKSAAAYRADHVTAILTLNAAAIDRLNAAHVGITACADRLSGVDAIVRTMRYFQMHCGAYVALAQQFGLEPGAERIHRLDQQAEWVADSYKQLSAESLSEEDHSRLEKALVDAREHFVNPDEETMPVLPFLVLQAHLLDQASRNNRH